MCSIIVLAGGVGTRMKNSVPKQYMLLAGKPIIMHTIEKINSIDAISEIIIVCAQEYVSYLETMFRQYYIKKTVKFALAGDTRQASVRSGLKMVNTENVMIHEAARPFVKKEEFEEIINSQSENVILGSPINFTVLKGNSKVCGILNRSELVNVQLPQKFNTELLLASHLAAKKEGIVFTEDASLVHYYNPDVRIDILPGKEYNIKLTNPIDTIIGEHIYNEFFC